MKMKILSVLAVGVFMALIMGCESPKLAQVPLTPEEHLWSNYVKESGYGSWEPPQTVFPSTPEDQVSLQPTAPEVMIIEENPMEIDITGAGVVAAKTGLKEEKIVSEPQSYTIEHGDSLWKISEKFYGDGRKWQLISDANKTTITTPNKLKVGTKITIPANK